MIFLDVTVSTGLDSTEGPPESEKKQKIKFRLSEALLKHTFPRGKSCPVVRGDPDVVIGPTESLEIHRFHQNR